MNGLLIVGKTEFDFEINYVRNTEYYIGIQ